MPVDEALALMMVEMAPYGYSAHTVEMLVSRAFRATQEFLARLRWADPGQGKIELERALKNDALQAAHWRAQTREVREAHAKVLNAPYEARMALERLEREGIQAAAQEERRARYAKQLAEVRLLRAKAEWKVQFDHWMARNEEGGWKAHAAQRAADREREDEHNMRTLLAHIRQAEKSKWHLSRGTFPSMLNLLSDHDYIDWMFSCCERGLQCPV